MSIYKPCDIRGNAATELSPALYGIWGQSLAARIGAGKTMVTGGDVRSSTPPFLVALIDGLRRGGANVIDLGQLRRAIEHNGRLLRVRCRSKHKGGKAQKGETSVHWGHVPQTHGGKKGSLCPEMAFSAQVLFI